MKNQERLFLAIGGADPELVARAERKRRSRWPGYCLAAAACLALVLTAGYVFQQRTVPPTVSGVTPELRDPLPPVESRKPDPNGARLVLPEQGSEIGDLRLLNYAPQSQDETVDFLIYVNKELFSIREEDGLYSVRNNNSLPDGFPECGLDILHLSGTSRTEAKTAAEKALAERYTDIKSEELAAALPDSLYLRASAGTDWNSEQAELWFVGDGQGGTFVLTARYFLEAEEGMGMRFRDMVSSFRAVSRNEIVPDWMRSLYEAADRLFPALLSNDLSGVSDLLAAGADPDAYGEDVWEYLSVASVDYAPDNDQDPDSATVSVKHRLNQEEGESYNYLTMGLIRQDGQWRLAWSGIEK
ncbi:hypothetical protein [Oscillibacter sp.]|uniref:hypothetical protein n=1 Tax=Oscillibacter sp. TaxID=1945593 RepID=UPI002D7F8581|nr:hypothetical protein [Oscillibacter sp.]